MACSEMFPLSPDEQDTSRRGRALAVFAGNDNAPEGSRGKVMATVLGPPMICTAAIADLIRFLP